MTVVTLNSNAASATKGKTITNWAICGTIIGITVWLYAPTRNYEFVNWDDTWYVVHNPLIQSWNLENLKAIATENVLRNYAPLTIFSLLVDYSLWGDWAGGYHLVNVLLHAVNAVLVYFLVRLVTGRTILAAITAILFAVHPVHVESVAWISSRKGLLSGVFMLSSLLCWLRADRTPKHEVWGIAFLAMALLAKANAVVLPAIVLTYDVIVLRRPFREGFVRQVIPGILAVWCLLANMSAQFTILGGVRGHFELSKLEILAVDGIILWKYIGMLLCPRSLCVLYNPPTTGIWAAALLAAAGWVLVSWWVWTKRTQHPLLLFAYLSWMLLLLPVLNLFPITTLMNDRYLYLPSIAILAALLGCLGTLIHSVDVRKARYGSLILAGLILVLVALGLVQRTRNYLPVWRNDLALWEHANAHVPELCVVQIQRAISLHNAGDTHAALCALDHALLHCNPDELDQERIEAKKIAWQKGE